MRGTTVDAEPVQQESTCPADVAAALHAARNGDENGFSVLYRDLQPRLARYATVLVGRDDADDVTAEAWLQIARDLHTFTGNLDDFRGWWDPLESTCRHASLSIL